MRVNEQQSLAFVLYQKYLQCYLTYEETKDTYVGILKKNW